MNFSIEQLLLLAAGFFFSGIGGALVFNNRFFNWVEQTWWKRTGRESSLFSGQNGRFFDRYGRGLGMLLMGIVILSAVFRAILTS